jgi:NCS1 family nucleobase:cation symporter-1
MIADYFLVRKRTLEVDDLYRRGGIYEYRNGVNPCALVSLVLGIAVALLGLAIPPLRWLYDYAWFVGFAVSALTYLALMRGATDLLPTPSRQASGGQDTPGVQPTHGGHVGD